MPADHNFLFRFPFFPWRESLEEGPDLTNLESYPITATQIYPANMKSSASMSKQSDGNFDSGMASSAGSFLFAHVSRPMLVREIALPNPMMYLAYHDYTDWDWDTCT